MTKEEKAMISSCQRDLVVMLACQYISNEDPSFLSPDNYGPWKTREAFLDHFKLCALAVMKSAILEQREGDEQN